MPPKNLIISYHTIRLGNILSNIAFTAITLLMMSMLASILVPLIHAFVALFSVLVFLLVGISVIFTFGLILLDPDNPIVKMLEFIEKIGEFDSLKITNFCIKLIPYFCYVGIAASILGIILLASSKLKGNKGKIVALVIFTILMIVVLVLYYVLKGGALWQS